MNDTQRQMHSSYWIFLKSARKYSDADLLREFGLSDYLRTSWPNELEGLITLKRSRTVAFGSSGEWTCVVDDRFYTLWNMHTTRPTLARLAGSCDVFSYSLGDCNNSHDLVYYRDGQLVRKYVVIDSPEGGQQEVFESIGEPINGESQTLDFVDFQRGITAVGQLLGFSTSYKIADLRFYTKLFEL